MKTLMSPIAQQNRNVVGLMFRFWRHAMSQLQPTTRWIVLAAAIIPISCGTGANIVSNRELQTITVTPATASAQGQPAQFTATGHWSAAPVTVTPQAANWGACVQQTSGNTVMQSATTEVTVSSSGLAQCASGAKGTFTVFAYDPPLGSTGANCNAITVCGGGCTISGTAQLTCP
jgi:hypothetical protein